MKKSRNKKVKTISVLSVGIVLVSALLFVGLVLKSSFSPQLLHVNAASSKKTIPFMCPQCNFAISIVGPDRFSGRDFTNAYLPGARIFSSNGDTIDFSGSTFTNADFRQGIGLLWQITNTDFTGAIFDAGQFNWQGTNAIFSNASFIGSNFTAPPTPPTQFTNANLSNANFTNANLQGSVGMDTATLTGVIWSNTTCPDGTNSNNDGNTCVGHLTP